jgi:diguanylate cyclase (GGDEF)-like protein
VAGGGALLTTIVGSVIMVLLNGSIMAAMPQILAIFGVAILSVSLVIWALREVLAPIDELERALEFYRENGLDGDRPHDQDRSELVHLVDGLASDARAHRNAADTDPLTGLLNRRGFDRYRKNAEAGSIIFVDLDKFKIVNDRLGHDAGDIVLSATADLLRSVLRQGELVARFGGEEFVVFLPGIELDTAAQVAERIRQSAETNLATELGRVTISAGVCRQADGETFADALHRADQAVYLAKRDGRNRVRVHDPDAARKVQLPAAAAE